MLISNGHDGLYALYDSRGIPVDRGTTIFDREGQEYTVEGGAAPLKPGSTGRVYVRRGGKLPGKFHEFFPSVVGLEWRQLRAKLQRVFPSMHSDPEWRLTEKATNHWTGTMHGQGGNEVADLTYLASQDFEAAWALAKQFCASNHAVDVAFDRSGDINASLDAAVRDYTDCDLVAADK